MKIIIKVKNICSDGTDKINARGVYLDGTDYNKNQKSLF